MIRQHQFYKVELVSIIEPNKCLEELERMLGCAESILEKLEYPIKLYYFLQGTWDLVQKKHMILRLGFHLKTNSENFKLLILWIISSEKNGC